MQRFTKQTPAFYALLGAVLLILITTTCFVSLFSIRSCNDVWWHLKSGQVILEARSLPETDVFTLEGEQYEWVNHEWLAQVVFYLVYLAGNESFRFLTVFKTFLLAIALLLLFYYLYKETEGHLFIPLFACIWALWLSKHTIYIRPPMFTYIFFVIFFYYMRKLIMQGLSKYEKIFLVACMVLWTNLHGGAVLGIILLGAAGLDRLFSLIINRDSWKKYIPHIQLGVLLCLAILLNPWGYKTLLLPFKVLLDPVLPEAIFELQPPELEHLLSVRIYIPLLLASLLAMRRKLLFYDVLCLGYFAYEAFNSVRHLPLFGLISSFYFALALYDLYKRTPDSAIRKFFNAALIVATLSTAGYINSIHYPFLREFFQNPRGYIARNYPEKLTEFIISRRIPGPFFNDENFSGYLIWRLSPEYAKIFTDVRFDIFASDHLPYTFSVKEGWTEGKHTIYSTLNKFPVNGVILYQDAPGALILNEWDEWHKIYQDHRFVLFVRNDEPSEAKNIEKLPD